MTFIRLPRPVHICNCGDHAWVSLTRGYVTLVSPQDVELLKERAWTTQFDKQRNKFNVYARCFNLRLHREILQAGPDDQIDHANGNALDNRRDNLRLATNQNNSWNAQGHHDGTSQYKGVSWHRQQQRWRSRIYVSGKNLHLGCYAKEVHAAAAYDEAARKHFGPYARLNFP